MVNKKYLAKSLRPGKPFGEQIRALSRQEALKVVKKQSETLTTKYPLENQQLFHNQPWFHYNVLYSQHGDQAGDSPGRYDIRQGDELYLQNIKLKFMLFNKQDRPNVHYRIMMFWYESGTTPNALDVLDAMNNLLLNSPNRENISVILDRTIAGVYPAPTGREFSKVVKMNKRWKNKKIVYNDTSNANSVYPKQKDIGIMVVAYDAFGTLITDNIASFALQYDVRFKEN